MARTVSWNGAPAAETAAQNALGDLIASFSDGNAVAWLRRKFPSFSSSAEGRATPAFASQNDREYFDAARIIGFVESLPGDGGENKPVVVASVSMRRPLSERTSRLVQFEYAKRIVKDAFANPPAGVSGLCSQALVFFHDADGNFRLSLVTCRIDGRRLVWSEARRHSFFCRAGRPCNTMRRRLRNPIASFRDLGEAFSVEALTKEFYSRLFQWYEWACAPETKVSFPNVIGDATDDRKKLPEAVIRLITRLLFVWFVRERGLVPGALFDSDAVDRLLKGFRPESMEDGLYYRAILQNLFFATLNVPPAERTWSLAKKGNGSCVADHHVVNRYRFAESFRNPDAFFAKSAVSGGTPKGLVARTPFLNCSLFDCLDRRAESGNTAEDVYLDGFSRNPRRQAFLPNGLFFGDGSDEPGHEGLIRLLDAYEFTIDENAASDGDVALDPELLGKVFENLLGAFNPETKEAARKMTGSFYTPREIVDYMVEQSLRAYLESKMRNAECGMGNGDGGVRTDSAFPAKLDDLFSRARSGRGDDGLLFTRAERAPLLEALYDCRTLDPACGSGAFPMGLLHLMTRLLSVLDPDGRAIQERILRRHREDIERVSRDSRLEREERERRLADLDAMLAEQTANPDYARKLWIIENCIYGVDIQPIAAQISKLRFYISLLCDQPDPPEEAEGGVAPSFAALPNLESKFVCANTLLKLPDIGGEFDFSGGGIPRLRDELREIRHRIFQARGWETKRKYQRREKEKRDEIAAAVRASLSSPDEAVIAREQGNIAKNRKLLAAVAAPNWVRRKKAVQGSLFDILAATPEQEELELVDENAEMRAELRACIAQSEKIIAREKAKAGRAVGNTDVERLSAMVAAWDPYDQNASADFFDPDWMFDVKDGFDVVIGNPPYDQIYKGTYSATAFPYSEGKDPGKQNLYKLFVEASKQFALAETGSVCLIVQSSLMGDMSAKYTRELLLDETVIKHFIEFPKAVKTPGAKVFKSVLQGTCIVSFKNKIPPSDHKFAISIGNDLSTLSSLRFDYISQASIKVLFTDYFEIPLLSPGDSSVISRVRSTGTSFETYIADTAQGNINTIHLGRIASDKVTGAFIAKGEHIHRWKLEPSLIPCKVTPETEALFSKNTGRCAILTQNISGTTDIRRINAAPVTVSRETRIVFLHTVNIAYLRHTEQLLYVCAVLNSRVVDWIFRKTSTNNHLNMYELIKIPFPASPSPVAVSRIESLVDRILAAKKADSSADTSALEQEIDKEVYKLYGLTDGEIAIVEGRGGGRPSPAAEKNGSRERAPSCADAVRARRPSILDEDEDIL